MKAEMENGIKTENMVIGGFSQGGALALHYTLRRLSTSSSGLRQLTLLLHVVTASKGIILERSVKKAKSSLRLFQAHGARETKRESSRGANHHTCNSQVKGQKRRRLPVHGDRQHGPLQRPGGDRRAQGHAPQVAGEGVEFHWV